MQSSHNAWIKDLVKKGWLSPLRTVPSLRLSPPLRFVIPKIIVDELVSQYDPSYEKGGVMMANFEIIKGEKSLVVKHLVFLDNFAGRPTESFHPDEKRLKEVIEAGFFFHLIPLIFHTHPTKSGDIIEEVKNFHYQMETSDADRFTSLGTKYSFDGCTLRLPEVLVIGNGTLKHGLFVGLYGGLVAPTGFDKQKNKRIYNCLLKLGYEIASSINSVDDFIVASTLGLVAHGIASQNKVAVRRLVQEMRELLPPLIYATADKHDFFGITHMMGMTISLPSTIEREVIEEENLLRERAKAAYAY